MESKSSIFIKNFDFLGHEFKFENENSSNHKSFQGLFFSFAVSITLVIITFMFGREVYERKTPKINLSNQHNSSAEIFFNEYPFTFTFGNEFAEKLGNINEYFFVYIENYKVSGKIQKKLILTLIPCKELNFSKFKFESQLIGMYQSRPNNHFCLNSSDTLNIKNKLGQLDSSSIIINFAFCDPNNKSCKYNKDKKDNMYIEINFWNSYVDNESFFEPVKYELDVSIRNLAADLHKIDEYYFSQNKYYSNDGWILNDIRAIDFTKLSSIKSDINLNSGSNIKWVYSVILQIDTLSSIYTRSFLKVQELFANIGGVLNALLIITKIFASNYLRFKYLLYIREQTFETYEKNENEKFNDKSSLFRKSLNEEEKLSKANLVVLDKVVNEDENMNEDMDKNFNIKQNIQVSEFKNNNLELKNNSEKYFNKIDVKKEIFENYNKKEEHDNLNMNLKIIKLVVESKKFDEDLKNLSYIRYLGYTLFCKCCFKNKYLVERYFYELQKSKMLLNFNAILYFILGLYKREYK